MKMNFQGFAKCQKILGYIFSLEKWVMSMYMPLIAKMVENSPSLMAPKVNLKLFCDMILFIFLSCLLLMLKIIHARITFVHKWNIFICDYVVAIKIWLNTFTTQCMHLKWKVTSLYFNISSSKYFYFDSMDFTFWVTCLNAHGEKIHVSKKIFISFVDDAKPSCFDF
jgi:hypothetical protein